MEDAEIIKAVAEKVMGWEKKDSDIDAFWSHPEYGARYYLRDWNPLTNANYWMMILERMKELNFEVRVYLFPKAEPHVHISNLMLSKKYPYRSGDIKDNSIGRAICLAALKAVEEK